MTNNMNDNIPSYSVDPQSAESPLWKALLKGQAQKQLDYQEELDRQKAIRDKRESDAQAAWKQTQGLQATEERLRYEKSKIDSIKPLVDAYKINWLINNGGDEAAWQRIEPLVIEKITAEEYERKYQLYRQSTACDSGY